MENLAALHSVDFVKAGLGDFASTSDYYPRQLKSLTRISKAQAEHVKAIPVEQFAQIYDERCPRGEVTIVHGDYKLDNMVSRTLKNQTFKFDLRDSRSDFPSDRTESNWYD